MSNLEKIKKHLRERKKALADKYSVKRIGIFGSYIHGEARRGSDIDMLVEFSEPIDLFEFMRLQYYLEDLVGRKVDLVSRKALKPYIGRYILEEVQYL